MTDAKPDVGALVREIEFTMPQNKDMACGYDELLDRCRTALLALQAEVAQIKAQSISDMDRMTATRVRLDNEVATLRHSLGYVRLTLDEAVPGMDEGAPIEAIARKVKAEVARLTQAEQTVRQQFADLIAEKEAYWNAERDRLTQENARLAGEWKRECDDADGLLSAIGLDPAQYRTKGGSLMVTKAANAIKEARRDE